MACVKAPVNLPALVRTAFAKARSDGELSYFPTQVTILRVGSIPFQLRFSPALANKPKGPPPDASPPVDPFAHPPPGLVVADVGPAHYLVLNKFAVVPEHFILATRRFRPQTHVLEAADLDATRACIRAYAEADADADAGADAGGRLFAFFNCGPHSGASQPHRHIQLLPVARMRDGLDGGGDAWDVLAERADLDDAPFATFSEGISAGMSSAELHAAFLRLYRRACRAVAAHAGAPADADAPAEGEAQISYNMAMTGSALVVCPRLSEGEALRRDGEAVGRLALNGTVLAGTALVRSEAEWEALRGDPRALEEVLKTIGVPRGGSDEGTKL